MFASLETILEDCDASQQDGYSHLITDTPYVSSNPFIVYHLLHSITNRKRVCFLAFQNTWSHYCFIASKLGVNLRNKTKEVQVVELMKFLPQILTAKDSDNLFNFLVTDTEFGLKDLYHYIKSVVERLKEDSAVTLIIDSVTPLLNLGVKESEVDVFIQYCSNLLEASRDTLVLSCMNTGSSLFINRLASKFLIHLAVKGLSTGWSKDIHGELSVSKNNSLGLRKSYKYLYKVEERDVKLYPVDCASKVE